MKHFLYVPFTGLGLYGGSRGNRWLKDRIKIFKQFVVPSVKAQTNQNFMLWLSWRPEDRRSADIANLYEYLQDHFPNRVVFTFNGVAFWDDKYPDEEAHVRLISALHGSMRELINLVGESKDILMTIQPSDDCYNSGMVEEMQTLLSQTEYQAVGYKHGYIMNYLTGELREYNPKTNPPFFTIKFPKEIFIDPLKHAQYTGPYKSHEYVGEKLRYLQIPSRGFLVGCHGQNISTHFGHPYRGDVIPKTMLDKFGILHAKPIKIYPSLRKRIMTRLPHRVQRKLRYIFGEKIYQTIYKTLHG